jgi:PadR family transcriptional regulator PadR
VPIRRSASGVSLASLILGVLDDAPMHGYAIAREIEKRSDDALSFGEGTLYPALRSLERDGFIQGVWDEGERSRKIYTLTQEGIEEIERIREEWLAYCRSVNQVIGRVGEATS